MKTIGITGGTGLIGKHLKKLLLGKGYEVIIFTRNTSLKTRPDGLAFAHWDPVAKTCDLAALKRLDAVVHLAGAGVADKRWTDKRKQEIVDSRVNGTSFLISMLKEHTSACKTFIGASATGYYGPSISGRPAFTEDSAPFNDFLGNTCVKWEAESAKAKDFARTVILRFGIVLGKESGAFPQFANPQSLGVVPVLGYGTQVVSWIEVDDLARFIIFALDEETIAGTYNAVAPAPVTQKELVKSIAAVKGGIKIPISVPAPLLHVLLGEMSIEVLKSCDVDGHKLLSTGFKFNHPDIQSAVKAILA